LLTLVSRKVTDTLYISSIAVLSAYRSKGFGLSLLCSLLRETCRLKPQLRSSLLLVGEHWHAAKAMYQRAGFELVTEIAAGQWNDGEIQLGKGVVMKLSRPQIDLLLNKERE